MTTSEERWLIDRSPILASFVEGLRRLGGHRYSYQVRKLYGLCHEYEISEVEKVAERAVLHDLFDVTRLEGMLLLEFGARLFTFNRSERGHGPGSVTPVEAPVDARIQLITDIQDVEKNDPEGKTNGGNGSGVA
jgi:hypothetical protein